MLGGNALKDIVTNHVLSEKLGLKLVTANVKDNPELRK
jgi:hypothetical protein